MTVDAQMLGQAKDSSGFKRGMIRLGAMANPFPASSKTSKSQS